LLPFLPECFRVFHISFSFPGRTFPDLGFVFFRSAVSVFPSLVFCVESWFSLRVCCLASSAQPILPSSVIPKSFLISLFFHPPFFKPTPIPFLFCDTSPTITNSFFVYIFFFSPLVLVSRKSGNTSPLHLGKRLVTSSLQSFICHPPPFLIRFVASSPQLTPPSFVLYEASPHCEFAFLLSASSFFCFIDFFPIWEYTSREFFWPLSPNRSLFYFFESF